MNKDLDKLKEIFLAEEDPQIAADNADVIKEWENGLIKNEAFASWKEHDVTKEIIQKAKASYREMAFELAANRSLTETQRMALWAKQDAMQYLLHLVDRDAKGVLEHIQSDIKAALNSVI